ncbi:MAG: hypothetical protein RR253_03070 [Oscillospiraceae bacterium]
MLNDKYKSELDRIKADDDFKQRTIKMLEEKQSQLKNSGNEIIFDTSAPKGKTIKFKSVLSVAACVAFMAKTSFFQNSPLSLKCMLCQKAPKLRQHIVKLMPPPLPPPTKKRTVSG